MVASLIVILGGVRSHTTYGRYTCAGEDLRKGGLVGGFEDVVSRTSQSRNRIQFLDHAVTVVVSDISQTVGHGRFVP